MTTSSTAGLPEFIAARMAGATSSGSSIVLAETPIDLAIPATPSGRGKSMPRYWLCPSSPSTIDRYLSMLSFSMRYESLLQTT